MNNFFSNIVKNLDIQGFIPENNITQNSDNISSILEKFKNHPSILTIKEKVQNPDKISLTQVCEKDIVTEINNLNTRRPTTFKSIPVRLITEYSDICAPHIRNIYNNSLKSNSFPNNLKMADVIPGFKKDDKTNKENYRPIIILPAVSKIFERIMKIKFIHK